VLAALLCESRESTFMTDCAQQNDFGLRLSLVLARVPKRTSASVQHIRAALKIGSNIHRIRLLNYCSESSVVDIRNSLP